VLLDTSGLLCYLDRSDSRHRDAVGLLRSAPLRLTHSYVLAEFTMRCPLCGAWHCIVPYLTGIEILMEGDDISRSRNALVCSSAFTRVLLPRTPKASLGVAPVWVTP